MARVTGEIFIRRPVDDVFDVVADERNEPLYNPELLRCEKVTVGPVGVGTRFRAEHRQGRRTVAMTVEITGVDRPHRVSSKTRMPWADVDGELSLEPVGRGTRLRWEWEVRPKGWWRILTPVVGPLGRRSERACWEGLRRYLEGEEVRGRSERTALDSPTGPHDDKEVAR